MSSLVRKIIIDRNGHQTVRWAYPEGEAAPKTSLPPAPAPLHPMHPQMQAKRIADRFRTTYAFDEYNQQGVASTVEALQWETIHALNVELTEGKSEEQLSTLGVWIEFYGDREPYLRDLLAFRGCFTPYTDRDFIEQAVTALSSYEMLPKCEEYGTAEDEVLAVVRNLLRATDSLLSDEYDLNPEAVTRFALPQDLAELVVGRPGDFDRINGLIGEGVTDPQRITMMLDSDTPSLNSGVL